MHEETCKMESGRQAQVLWSAEDGLQEEILIKGLLMVKRLGKEVLLIILGDLLLLVTSKDGEGCLYLPVDRVSAAHRSRFLAQW